MKNKNWFWGTFFILLAVSIIAIQTGDFGQIGVLSLIIGVFLSVIIIYNLVKLNFFGVFFPMAFLYMIFWKPLGLTHINYWLVILSSVLISIGFSFIFGRGHHKDSFHHKYKTGEEFKSESIDDNNPDVSVRFGSAGKYLHADNMQSGKFKVSFGELELFFDQVQLKPEGTEIFVDCSFGSLILNIPRQWRVKENIHVTLGEVKKGTRPINPAEDSPKLTISGTLQVGSIEIRYI